MPQGVGGFAFDAFLLDVRSQRLFHHDVVVPLRPRDIALLHELIAHAPDVVSKERLFEVGWPGVIVDENALVQVILQLRTTLDSSDPKRYIQSAYGRGYRFVGTVTRAAARVSSDDLDAMLAPYRALVDGRAMIETLELSHIRTARDLFARGVEMRPDDPTMHVGLANACALIFESTRIDLAPDVESLRLAIHHAREACRLAPEYDEALATLGFALWCARKTSDAIGAIRCALSIAPDNWRHCIRLGYASWGTERLWAAGRVLDLLPGCPIAHWLIASVNIALHRAPVARRHIAEGLAAIPCSADSSPRFSVVGLNWIGGLLDFDAGHDDESFEALAVECREETRGHVYSRECAARAWASIGVCHFKRGRLEPAAHAFGEALTRIPWDPMARVGLMMTGAADHPALALASAEVDAAVSAGRQVEAAIARAAWLSHCNDRQAGVQLVLSTVAAAPPGNAGWLIPIDPSLSVSAYPTDWAPVLTELRSRAS